ncbi:MAG: hypothetical protein J6K17_14730 [Oscillospiraceae bacterium]|nr:hypothetical protein [Oscillospiraceae bacterium]
MADNEKQVGGLKTYVDTEDKAHFVFEGVVESNIPLLTDAQNFAEAINELFAEGTGAANGYLRAVLDDETSSITIVAADGDAEAEGYTDYLYGYTVTDYSEDITMQTTVADTVTTTTKSISKRVVAQLYRASDGVVLLTAEDDGKGNIIGYTDQTGQPIYTAEWRTELVEAEANSDGADSAAIAWVLARNMEQAVSFEQRKQDYRDGVKVGIKGGADISEPWEKPIDDLDVTFGENGEMLTDGDLTDMSPEKGLYATCTDDEGNVTRYLHLWFDDYYSKSSSLWEQSRLCWETYYADGTLYKSGTAIGQSYSEYFLIWENYYSSGDHKGEIKAHRYTRNVSFGDEYIIIGIWYWEAGFDYPPRMKNMTGLYYGSLGLTGKPVTCSNVRPF